MARQTPRWESQRDITWRFMGREKAGERGKRERERGKERETSCHTTWEDMCSLLDVH